MMAMSFCSSVGLFVTLSPVKLLKSFATWRRAGTYRMESDTFVSRPTVGPSVPVRRE